MFSTPKSLACHRWRLSRKSVQIHMEEIFNQNHQPWLDWLGSLGWLGWAGWAGWAGGVASRASWLGCLGWLGWLGGWKRATLLY
jgi:hypothetical protein